MDINISFEFRKKIGLFYKYYVKMLVACGILSMTTYTLLIR